jgi:hypothetical protein
VNIFGGSEHPLKGMPNVDPSPNLGSRIEGVTLDSKQANEVTATGVTLDDFALVENAE